ncbi:MAG: OmpA family protein [Gammaproteobacteria bacterium]|nr:OmpA family protein [Gammaproteobacteria bacterium]
MSALRILVTGLGLATVFAVNAADVDEAPMGEAVERHLSLDEPFMQWVQDPDRVDTELSDTIETRDALADGLETIKLTGLVPPVYFESGVAKIPAETVVELGEILASMRDRMNLRLHLVGHADSQPLSPRLQEVYGDNMGLSRERAGEVAEYMQTALALPPEGVSYSWEGDLQPVASNANEAGRALNRRVAVEVWYDEVRQKAALEEVLVEHDVRTVKVCRMETVCKLRYVEGHSKRARVQNLIAPLQFEPEGIDVSERFISQVRESLDNLADKQNVVVKFVGYTDALPLSGRTERIYGDHIGLSKARARRVALAVQDALELPTDMLLSDGRGADRSIASNETAQGRAANRRVEVEFWYDDPLQELPDEPQLCPGDAGAEMVTRVYDPPWGTIPVIAFANGQPVIPDGYAAQLRRGLGDVADKVKPRLRFVGYTRNERLERRTAAVYGDDIGLSASRARRAMEQVAQDMELDPQQTEFEGRGFVHSDDVVNAGFIQGETSHVAVQVVYDELAVLDEYEGVDVTRMTRELSPENPLGLNMMRITVDGVPIDDPNRSSSDVQRCTDVAFAGADISFGYDNLRSSPRLSVTAEPSRIDVAADDSGAVHASPVRFRMYTNYSHFVERAEVRVFRSGQSLEAVPLEVVDLELDGETQWQPRPGRFRAPGDELAYVLRVYGKDGNFDETRPQPLWVVYGDVPPAQEDEDDDIPTPILAAYGENSLGLHNIGLSSGTVSVRGDKVPAGHEVWVAGRPIPVSADGSFIAEEILPQGSHTVEVAVLDEEGAGNLYLRDLEFEDNDWFYVGMADVTVSSSSANGPAGLMQGENSQYDYDSSVDGRLAFFVDGKFGDHWRVTASADTREGPVKDLFSNFLNKSPDSLFRRIDSDYHYPTFGDDSTVQEMAPTMGKFFVRVSQDDNFGQWGNFKIAYMDNELARVDRGLYGANLHYESDAATDFGDKRFAVDAFAAEPGTVGSRDEFRGTGGSLYFLRHQDLLAGSERLRIEIRDKTSGIVTGVVNLTPGIDYDVDYLQGRILLTEPLASTSDDNLLVRSGALSGDEAWLVARYEYTPGFDDIDAISTGGQAHYWVADLVRIGVTANVNEQDGADSSLQAADLTLKLGPDSWLKVQQAQSEGLVSLPVRSDDGGFDFASPDASSFVNTKAGASRADLSFRLRDFIGTYDTRLTMYVQKVEAGYSAPGLTALSDTDNYGGTLSVPVGDRFSFGAKVDKRTHDLGMEIEAQEYNVGYQVGDSWDVSVGYRRDQRTDSSILVPLTQDEGERTDAVVQVGYDSKADWNVYGFVQDTLSVSGTRRENARAGVGGTYQVTDKLQVDAEVSNGDLGAGGRLGSNYLYSDRTSLYLGYTLENERSDYGMRNGQGSEGNLVAGLKTRLGDSASVFLEERYQHGNTATGLTHSAGINFAPDEKWTLGFNTDIGTLQDVNTGAETERLAAGVQVALHNGGWQLSSGIEYRNDDVEQLDLTRNERETWLFRNNLKFQLNPSSRLFGKLNYAESESSTGAFFDGGYTEAVFGYALRPVNHDRLNTMVKYTYFFNVPTTGQVGGQNVAAEFMQKSHIAAVDVTYDVTPNLTLGGKYAYRLGQVSLDRVDPVYFDNNANLYVLRGDYRFRDNWEVLVETRLLDMPDLNESRAGALAAVSRYFGDHIKLGLGYNFTDFSDDLTDLSFDHQGFFLNLTGSM